ncbi:MAG: outer membrane beta-barrel protein [Acidobacteriaceae bacterium]
MKKLLLLFCLLPMLAATGIAQESRQDASISYLGTYQPTITGNAVTQTNDWGKGVLLSYRFMLTPSSALEGNYQYSQFNTTFSAPFIAGNTFHTSLQEGSVAYVRSFVYKKFNPFAEVGAAILLFDPINDTGTNTLAGSRTKATALLTGGGIAYELSPSWDLRVQYRAEVFKSIDFGISNFKTNRWYVMQQPAIGFAYHF